MARKSWQEKKGLGRLVSPDERDKMYPLRLLVPRKITVSHRYYRTGPILDQGNTSQCVGYSWRQFLSSAPLMTRGGPTAGVIYKGAQEHDEWPGSDYDGSSARGGVKFLEAKIGNIQSYVWAWHAKEVADWLLAGKGTIVVGTNWYDEMFDPDEKGRLLLPDDSHEPAGGHAYLVNGYSRSKGAFRITNSWGKEWAQGGRAWILEADMERLLQEDGEAVAAIERKIEPATTIA